MVYFIGTKGLEFFSALWSGIDREYRWLYYPDLEVGNTWRRRAVHLCWRLGIIPRWKCYPESFYREISDIGPNDHVVVFAYFPEPVLGILPFFNRSAHIHLWLWDNFSKLTELKKYLSVIKKQNVSIHTFDPVDAKVYGIGYLPQFFSVKHTEPAVGNVRDCFYVGQANNAYRMKLVGEIKAMLDNEECSSLFHLVDGKQVKFLSYSENLRLLKESRCVIEVCEESQCGLTLRSLEALAYNKKLITNNSYIKNYDFYRRENIFVWGVDNVDDFHSFLHDDFCKVPQEIIDGYDVNVWLEKILKN